MSFSGRAAVLSVLSVGLLVFLAACVKTVDLTPGGKEVLFMAKPSVVKEQLDDPERCKLVTTLRITAQGSTALTKANKQKDEARDRLVRARNAAARNGANLLIETGALEERTQSYKAYKCG